MEIEDMIEYLINIKESFNISLDINIKESFNISLDINIIFIKNFNKAYADKIQDEIIYKIKMLQGFPYIGPYILLNNENNVYRKLLIKKRYLIIYKIENKTIHIIYFFDSFKSINNQFKSYKF